METCQRCHQRPAKVCVVCTTIEAEVFHQVLMEFEKKRPTLKDVIDELRERIEKKRSEKPELN